MGYFLLQSLFQIHSLILLVLKYFHIIDETQFISILFQSVWDQILGKSVHAWLSLVRLENKLGLYNKSHQES